MAQGTTRQPLAHILVVEDHLLLRENMRQIMELGGYEVSTARDGLDGLRVLRESTTLPDLILVDTIMPEMDGVQFVTALQADERWQAIPFIFISARVDPEIISRTKDLGAEDYLPKPHTAKELFAAVQRVLSRAGSS